MHVCLVPGGKVDYHALYVDTAMNVFSTACVNINGDCDVIRRTYVVHVDCRKSETASKNDTIAKLRACFAGDRTLACVKSLKIILRSSVH